MMLFIKAFIIGIAKIIPGVSGAMLAINFKIYEKLIYSLTNFFSKPKENLKFILIFSLGVISSIILFSNIILYLITNYKFITMMFFIGLIIGGSYNFSKNIKYNYKNIILISIIIILFLFLIFNTNNNIYILKNNYKDNIMFFISGIIEIFASIVPGISGTSLLMLIGIYNEILKLISMVYDINYIFNHYNLYLSYGLGMFISFIINIYLINYCLKKYRNTTYSVILGLSISSIIYLIINTLNIKIYITNFIFGIMLLVLGMLLSSILDK